jgi:hypothetical protein
MDRCSLVRMARRSFFRLAVPGAAAVAGGWGLSSRALLVAGGVLLGLSLVPLAVLVGLGLERVGPAIRAWSERQRLAAALARLDAVETGGSEEEFGAACAHVRERIGSAPLDERLVDRGRPSRSRYLAHATLSAVERVAAKGDDPLAAEAALEARRRRNGANPAAE